MVKKRKPEIHYINYGIGFTICNKGKPLYIELNKNLKKYLKLRRRVLNHELLHWNSNGWWDDFKIDFFDLFNFKKSIELLAFCRKNPRAFLANSPVFFENGKIIPNYFLLGLWSSILLLIGGGIMLII